MPLNTLALGWALNLTALLLNAVWLYGHGGRRTFLPGVVLAVLCFAFAYLDGLLDEMGENGIKAPLYCLGALATFASLLLWLFGAAPIS